MKNKNNLSTIGLGLVIALMVLASLIILWFLFFNNADQPNVEEPPVIIDPEPTPEKPQLNIKDYKVYQFDNVDYRFIIFEAISDERIDLKQIETSEHFTLDQSSALISSLKVLGFDLNHLIQQEQQLQWLVPIYDDTLNEIQLSSETVEILNSTFDLRNPIEDTSTLGLVIEEPEPEPEPEPDPIPTPEPDPTVDPNFLEVAPDDVMFDANGSLNPVGYSSNVRIFVQKVQLADSASPITQATLTFSNPNVVLEAITDPFVINSLDLENILNRSDIREGVLIFQLNAANVNVNSLDHTLDIVGGN